MSGVFETAKYPYVRNTILYGFLYTMVYILTYLLAATTYSLIMPFPADQSRAVSWLYYGAFFTLLPNLAVLGIGYAINQQNRYKPHLLWAHALVTTQLVDKLGVALLAALLAKGFPSSWYGHNFLSSGYGLLCEELPFYCGAYVNSYLMANTVTALALYLAGYFVMRSSQNPN